LDKQDLEELKQLQNERKEAQDLVPLVRIDGNDGSSIQEAKDEPDEKHVEEEFSVDNYSDHEQDVDIQTLSSHDVPDMPMHSTLRKNNPRSARGTSSKALENIVNSAMTVQLAGKDPQSRKEALEAPDSEQWLEGEAIELADIEKRGVWKLVERLPGMKVLKNRFVYKRKRHPDNTIYQRKVRLVVKGFSQVKGVDYEDTFASMITFQSIKVLFFLMTFYKMVFWKVDIRTFFLYGECLEDVYMEQPEGYCDLSKPLWVCKLLKTLYGMKQAMRCANNKLRQVLSKMKIFPSASDDNVYLRQCDRGTVYLGAFVDDGCLICSSQELAQEIVNELQKDFEITVDKNPTTYLRFEIQRDVESRWFKIHQTQYTLQLLEMFQMSDCKPKLTPYSTQLLVPPRLITLDSSFRYQQLLGKLIWLSNTRPDIMNPVGILCRYMGRYNQDTWNAAKDVLRYLKGTVNFGIIFDVGCGIPPAIGEGVVLSAAVDANWGGRVDDSKSTSGLSIALNNICVHAKAKVQNRPALSTPESECNGVEAVLKEVEWYRGLLMELLIKLGEPTVVYQDNQTTIRLSEDCIAHQRTKYYRISQHYIRWCVANELAVLEYKSTDHMWCDVLTKEVSYPALTKHIPSIMGDQKIARPAMVARTKMMCRRRPPNVFTYNMNHRAAMNKTASKSCHFPPLEQKCKGCNRYCEWNKKLRDWRDCFTLNCDEVCELEVKCVLCTKDAQFNVELDQWYCDCENKRPKRVGRAAAKFKFQPGR
jgi:hypothetical protein